MRVPIPDEIPAAEELGRVHFVGIGGAGLSGIARVMLGRGVAVSGSSTPIRRSSSTSSRSTARTASA